MPAVGGALVDQGARRLNDDPAWSSRKMNSAPCVGTNGSRQATARMITGPVCGLLPLGRNSLMRASAIGTVRWVRSCGTARTTTLVPVRCEI